MVDKVDPKEEDQFDDAFNDVEPGKTEPSGDDTQHPKSDDVETLNELDDTGADDEPAQNDSDEEQDEDWKGKFQKLEQQHKSWEGRSQKERDTLMQERDDLQARLAQAEKGGSEADADEDAESIEGDSSKQDDIDDAEAELKAFYADYPELQGPLNTLLKRTKAEATGQVQELLSPYQQEQEAKAKDAHFKTITDEHDDFGKDLVSDMTEWVEAQPSFVVEGMRNVLKSGNAQEVVELVDQYKKDKGITKKQRQHEADDMEAVRSTSTRSNSRRGSGSKSSFGDGFDD